MVCKKIPGTAMYRVFIDNVPVEVIVKRHDGRWFINGWTGAKAGPYDRMWQAKETVKERYNYGTCNKS